ncbi:MAG TPA: hypothetical protein PK299_07870 [Anaerolineales bacterium]|nr:hypothetical protein [Anaerolineales bacterium]
MNSFLSLRPLRLPEIIDSGFRQYRKHFRVLFPYLLGLGILSAIVQSFFVGNNNTDLLNTLQSNGTFDSATFFSMYFRLIGLSLAISLIESIIQSIVITLCALCMWLSMRNIPFQAGTLWHELRVRLGKVLGLTLLSGLFYFLAIIWFIVPLVGWISGLGLLMIFQGFVVPIATPVLVFENLPLPQILGRAWRLTRRRFWWSAGLLATTFLLTYALQGVLTTVLAILLQYTDISLQVNALYVLQAVNVTITTLISFGILYPITNFYMNTVYLDLRVRTEGLDIQMAAQPRLAPNNTLAPNAFAITADEHYPQLIRMQDYGYLVGLSFMVFALIAVFFGIGIGLAFIAVAASAGM